MMRKYPKLPTGPSSLGAAAVRALDARGGDFQVSYRADGTTARIAGQFSRVTTGGFEYVTEGRIAATPNERKPFTTPNYRTVFIPAPGRPGTEYLGAATYFGAGPVSRNTASQPFTYPIDGAPARSAPYTNLRATSTIGGLFLTAYGTEKFVGSFVHTYDDFSYPALTYRPVELRNPAKAYMRRISGVAPDRVVISPFLTLGARVDAAGRELCDLALIAWQERAPSYGLTLTFARPDVEFIPFTPIVATDDFGAFLAMERFFWHETFDAGKDYRPRLRLIRLNGKDPASLSVFDVTTILTNDAYVPPPEPGNPIVPGLEDDYYAADLPLPRFVNAINTDTMALMRLCALEGNRFLVSYTALVSDPGWSSVDYRYRFRLARIDLDAPSATLFIDEALSGEPGASNATHKHIESMLHLGGDHVLAKRIAGWKGIDHAVTFMLSTDGGATWSDLAPTGLEAPLLNQNLGKMTLHRARVGGVSPANAIVLMPAWSATEQAYYVFESSDHGLTWQRRARIARPDAFYRMDNMLAGDGGPNFDLLLPGTNLLRVPDLASPGRYNQ